MHNVRLTQSAQEEISALPVKQKEEVLEMLASFEENPFPPGAKKLKAEDFYRTACGDSRILYKVTGDEVLVAGVVKREKIVLQRSHTVSAKTP